MIMKSVADDCCWKLAFCLTATTTHIFTHLFDTSALVTPYTVQQVVDQLSEQASTRCPQIHKQKFYDLPYIVTNLKKQNAELYTKSDENGLSR